MADVSWERIKEHGWDKVRGFEDIIDSWSEGDLRRELAERRTQFNEKSVEISKLKREKEHLNQEIDAIKNKLNEERARKKLEEVE